MTMTKSRRAGGKANPLPSLSKRWSDGEVDQMSRELVADLRASVADVPQEQRRSAEIIHVACQGRILEEKLTAWLEMAFARIDKLEAELRKTKGLKTKALDNRFTLDDLQVEQIDDRNVRMVLLKGEDEASFDLRFPVVVDRGIWTDRGAYQRGDAVSCKGSYWVAQRDDPGMPDTHESGWRLAVKRGRDGKDAR